MSSLIYERSNHLAGRSGLASEPMRVCLHNHRFLENSGATLMDRGYPILPHLAYLGRSSDFTCYAY
jgi:hypothetical protein